MGCQSTYPTCWQDFSALAGVHTDEFNASLEISSTAVLTPMKWRRILGGNKTLERYLPLFPLGYASSLPAHPGPPLDGSPCSCCANLPGTPPQSPSAAIGRDVKATILPGKQEKEQPFTLQLNSLK